MLELLLVCFLVGGFFLALFSAEGRSFLGGIFGCFGKILVSIVIGALILIVLVWLAFSALE